MQIRASIGTVVLLILLPACGMETPSTDTADHTEVGIPQQNNATYEVRGRIVDKLSDGRTMLVDHETIPGYMAAMTMPFTTREAGTLEGLGVGDAVTFTYHVSEEGMWITDIERLGSDVVSASPSQEAEPEYDEPAPGSMYWFDDQWTDQDGGIVHLGDFEGRPVIMSMIFTNCGYACPMIVRDMKRIGGRLPDHQSDDIQYLLVSLDPDRDTPEMMRAFASAHRLDLDQWTMIRGSKDQVRMLAAALGIRFRQESDGQFAHSNLVTILDASGEIAYQQRGLESDGRESAQIIRNLLASL